MKKTDGQKQCGISSGVAFVIVVRNNGIAIAYSTKTVKAGAALEMAQVIAS